MITLNDFKAEPVDLREAMFAAVCRVMESGWFVLGPEVAAFEQQWATTCGLRYGIGVGNGMDAIEIALRACGIGPGDEVVTTAMTAFATVLAIIRAGATPVLADIDPDTALLSIDSVHRCLTSKTKAVVLVHLYGQIRSMSAWAELCAQNNIFLLEDCAQAHLAASGGKCAGSFGDVGAFSFYPTKNLGALGDAGMVVTNDRHVAERARILRNYGQSERYHHVEICLNSRLDEVHAAMLAVRLRWLDSFTERRQQIAEAYRAGITNPAIHHLALPDERSAHVYHLYVIKSAHREALQQFLSANGVQTLIHYPIPIHQQPPCIQLRIDPLGLSASEAHSSQCVSLPCHPQMTDSEIAHVVQIVNNFEVP